jgi:uncharacterized membrane protein HdeD (DUF308 family)
MLGAVSRKWWVMLLRGLVAIALGVASMMMPGLPLATIALLFAAFSLADGVACIVMGMRGEPDGSVWWTMIFLGVLAAAAGIAAFAWPELTVLILVYIVAISAILRGVFEIIAAIRLRAEIEDEWVLGLSGAMSLLFGVLVYTRPLEGMVAIAILIGAYMVALGALAVALSLRLRRLQHRVGDAKERVAEKIAAH